MPRKRRTIDRITMERPKVRRTWRRRPETQVAPNRKAYDRKRDKRRHESRVR